jgi:cystathionine beta-lyase
LFSIVLGEGLDGGALVDALTLFGIGYSWGGFESLALPAKPHRTAAAPRAREIIRLHIGLEDPADLIADLEAGFASVR